MWRVFVFHVGGESVDKSMSGFEIMSLRERQKSLGDQIFSDIFLVETRVGFAEHAPEVREGGSRVEIGVGINGDDGRNEIDDFVISFLAPKQANEELEA